MAQFNGRNLDKLLKQIRGNSNKPEGVTNNDGVYRYNGLTQKEWVAQGRAHIVKTGSKRGWENSTFIREDGEEIELYSKKRPTTPQSVLDVGGHYDARKVSTRNNFVNNRSEREKVPEKLRSDFSSDAEYEAYKKYVREGVKSNIDLTNAQSVDGKEFDHGHVKALGAGGSNDPADQRLENRASNRSTQQNADPTDAQLERTGNARSWEEAGEFHREGRPANYFDLTPQDKQRIWNGEDADAVVEERKSALKVNPLAKPADSRFTRLGLKRNPTSVLHSMDPLTLAIRSIPEALKGINNNRKGAAIGGVSASLADPDAIADAMEGNYRGAAENVTAGVFGGAALQNILKVMPAGIQSLAGKVTPVLTGAQLFAEGRDGSATQRIVNKAADFTPGLKADPETDIGKRAGDFLVNQFNSFRNSIRPQSIRGRSGAQRDRLRTN
jgi:hypothetical protein